MTTIWELITSRRDVAVDPAAWYVSARAHGIRVEHKDSKKCFTWDSVAGQPGVFRTVGELRYLKDKRRWVAIAYADCTDVELCVLLSRAVREVKARPAAGDARTLRRKEWRHGDGKKWGRYAKATVAYQLDAGDLIMPIAAAEEVPDTVAGIVDPGKRELERIADLLADGATR